MTKDQQDKFDECFKKITQSENKRFVNKKDGEGQDVVVPMRDILDAFRPFIKFVNDSNKEKAE